jgi:hypothetical protein
MVPKLTSWASASLLSLEGSTLHVAAVLSQAFRGMFVYDTEAADGGQQWEGLAIRAKRLGILGLWGGRATTPAERPAPAHPVGSTCRTSRATVSARTVDSIYLQPWEPIDFSSDDVPSWGLWSLPSLGRVLRASYFEVMTLRKNFLPLLM